VSEPFPSLVIRADGFSAQGAFAEAQAEYLDPDPELVARLDALLRSRNAGVVAHFYMDPELQGALFASSWPHIHISDSLVMADSAVAMAQAGAREIVVLGVDFMSENVRAILDESDLAEVGCWRVAEAKIGCSLAESAEAPAYAAWLNKAAATPNSLHVVYINTSLRTKANAHHRVPTITCTSSNVVATVLQTFAQEPEAHVWFGPDTYMGQNLARLFTSLSELDDQAIASVHPAHTRESIAALLPRFHYFE
jgi:quinolinate synthase